MIGNKHYYDTGDGLDVAIVISEHEAIFFRVESMDGYEGLIQNVCTDYLHDLAEWILE